MSEVKGVPINSLVETFTPNLLMSTLKLFKAVPTKNQKKENPSKKMSQFTIANGFVFAPQVVSNYSEKELRIIADVIIEEFNITPEQMNSSFHKNWGKVRDAPITQLIWEQAFHYMTTYGYEQMGVFDKNTVFIPNERFDIPNFEGGLKLTLINGYTKKQLKEKLLSIINSGMAMASITELVEVAKFVDLTEDEVINMKNKEIRTNMYSVLDLIPEDPVELLRLALFESTKQTLLIVNKKTTSLIKESTNTDMADLFEQYDENFGYRRLAEIFNRFKPLFLAFKNPDSAMSGIINKISHLSKTYHKTMKYSYLNNITAMLNRGEVINSKILQNELAHVNIFRKIRLIQSLKYRISGNDSIMYKVRNGKAFAKKFNFTNIDGAEQVSGTILKSIASDLKHLKGKEFYIPKNLVYALPASEKQMTGMIPSGSYVTVGKDMIFGVHWTDVRNNRIDLDLACMSLQHGKIGWDSSYRSGTRSILFSGDNTSAPAPKGASELYYINKDYQDTVLVTLNYFNMGMNDNYISDGIYDNKPIKVPFNIMIADEHTNSFGSNYTINPNNIKCLLNSVIDTKQKILGLATVKDGECRFYFTETALGDKVSVKGTQYITTAMDYLAEFNKTQLTFNEVLDEVGATIVDKPTKSSIDLSIESLTKETFINLLFKP